MSIAEQIRTARREAGLSQVDLAVKAGVGLQTLRDIEQGNTADPRHSTVSALLAALTDQEPVADLPGSSATGSK